MSHNVVHQTARRDLLELMELGLLHGYKRGKSWHFTPVHDLEAKVAALGQSEGQGSLRH